MTARESCFRLGIVDPRNQNSASQFTMSFGLDIIMVDGIMLSAVACSLPCDDATIPCRNGIERYREDFYYLNGRLLMIYVPILI